MSGLPMISFPEFANLRVGLGRAGYMASYRKLNFITDLKRMKRGQKTKADPRDIGGLGVAMCQGPYGSDRY